MFENNNVIEQTNDASNFNEIDVFEGYCKIGIVIYPEDRVDIVYGTTNYKIV